MYRIEIWQFHSIIDEYKNNDISKVLNWYRQHWKYCYDWGNCSFEVYKNNKILSFDEENKLGFFEDDE